MRDYRWYAHQREIKQRRARQDAHDAKVHAAFDLMAQDKTAKFERARFAVVGEGSRSAADNYRKNYDAIDWR